MLICPATSGTNFESTLRNVPEERRSQTFIYINIIYFRIIIIIGIQPLGRSAQRPEFSQATGMALVRCILGKFLGVACHCLAWYKSVNLQLPQNYKTKLYFVIIGHIYE